MNTLPYALEPLSATRQRLFAILDLLGEIEDLPARADLASELVEVCSRYENVKESVVYPLLNDLIPDHVKIESAQEDQRQVRDALGDIRSRTLHVKPAYVHMDDPDGFEIALEKLVQSIHTHVDHEDEMLFPALERLDDEATHVVHRDTERAVTHASTHPNPPHNLIGRAVTAVEEVLERKVKDESTAWHPGLETLDRSGD